MPLSMPRWSGLTGSTTADCWNPSETFHQQNEKGRIIVNWKSRVKLLDSNKTVSGINGAVQGVYHPKIIYISFITKVIGSAYEFIFLLSAIAAKAVGFRRQYS